MLLHFLENSARALVGQACMLELANHALAITLVRRLAVLARNPQAALVEEVSLLLIKLNILAINNMEGRWPSGYPIRLQT